MRRPRAASARVVWSRARWRHRSAVAGPPACAAAASCPAPLAPSTHQTSPGRTANETASISVRPPTPTRSASTSSSAASVAHRAPLRSNNAMNTGAPSTAVIAPTGSCWGAITVRASVSASTSSVPPANALAGKDALIVADRQPQRMGDDEADESDRPGGGHGEGGGDGRDHEQHPADARHRDAERLRHDGAAQHHIERAPLTAERTMTAATSATSAGTYVVAPPRSPISQNRMPRSSRSGAIVSSSVTSADHPLREHDAGQQQSRRHVGVGSGAHDRRGRGARGRTRSPSTAAHRRTPRRQ